MPKNDFLRPCLSIRKAETSLETCCAPPHVLHTGTESAGTRTFKAPKSQMLIEIHDSNITHAQKTPLLNNT